MQHKDLATSITQYMVPQPYYSESGLIRVDQGPSVSELFPKEEGASLPDCSSS